jgi:hypothetical protein
MATNNIASVHLSLPKPLMLRAKHLCEVFHYSLHHIVREGLVIRIKQLEDQERDDLIREEETIRKRSESRGKMRRRVTGVGERRVETKLQRIPFSDSDGGLKPLPLPSLGPTLDATYEQIARTLIEAGNDPAEIKRRATVGVATVKRERPLTHPNEEEILAKIEENLVRLRQGGGLPKMNTVDGLVGKVIDTSKLKTLGDSGEENE